jgi:hypothetical protein
MVAMPPHRTHTAPAMPGCATEAAYDRSGECHTEAERDGQSEYPQSGNVRLIKRRSRSASRLGMGGRDLPCPGRGTSSRGARHSDRAAPPPPRGANEVVAVLVAGMIGAAVVLAMGGDPLDHRRRPPSSQAPPAAL